MNTPQYRILSEFLKAHTNFDGDELDDLARWVNDPDLPEEGRMDASEFKAELKYALEHPETVTPEIYNSWTYLEFESQEQVDKELQRVWNACYGVA